MFDFFAIFALLKLPMLDMSIKEEQGEKGTFSNRMKYYLLARKILLSTGLMGKIIQYFNPLSKNTKWVTGGFALLLMFCFLSVLWLLDLPWWLILFFFPVLGVFVYWNNRQGIESLAKEVPEQQWSKVSQDYTWNSNLKDQEEDNDSFEKALQTELSKHKET